MERDTREDHHRACRERLRETTLVKIAEQDARLASQVSVALDDYAQWQAQRRRLIEPCKLR